jgi:thiol-disulfide isomerase/thioredoxin
MKRLSLIITAAAVILAMASCDKLDEPYNLSPVVEKSDTIPLEAADTLNFDGKLVVLLEDYTGVKCPNCPAAAEIAAQLQEQYGEHLLVLGVHPMSALQNPAGGFPDFRTEDGDDWNDYFNISAYPTGTVNRMGAIGPAEWTAAVGELIGQNAPVRLIVKTAYDNSTREVRVSVHAKFMQDVESDDVRIIVCMMEDNIIGKQLTPDGVINEYTHRHVFRGTADGLTWGKLFTAAPVVTAGTNVVNNMKFTLDNEYEADEFYIMAMVTDHNTREVLMAAENKIK